MWPFSCNHPAKNLFVKKDKKTKNIDADFNKVTYHLFCNRCGKDVDIAYSEMIGGVDAFLKRGKL